MEQYIVSARKYRPSNFRTVIGQDSLTATLKNSILTKQLAHAFLFCGSRGVGKTTCARIFAKAINCMNIKEDGEPCNECESCNAFNENSSFNIHELDAASNNSVDDIRNIIEQVRIPPAIGKYSVYIIDEVHMLSKAAFNAFLKTLEEPPSHVIYILATTERHKILPTILSRCQVYNFNRIKINDTVKYLQYVASNEGINTETAALNVVAQKADGAMRDALSIFDQLVSFCGSSISYAQAIEHLNVLDYTYYFKITEYILKFNLKESLLLFDEILNNGFDAQYFLSGLASHFRDLLVSKSPETLKLLDVAEEIEDKYKKQTALCNNNFLYKAIELTNECDYNYKQSRNKRLSVELLLIKLSGINNQTEDAKKVSLKLPKLTATAVSDNKQTIVAEQNKPAEQTQGIINTHKTTQTAANNKVGAIHPNVHSFSIFGAQTKDTEIKKNEDKAHEVAIVQPTQMANNRELNLEELHKAWIKYANNIEKQAHVTNSMKNFMPIIENQNTIKVILANRMQLESLSSHKNIIERYIMNKLSCGPISLIITQDDGTHYANEAFTPSEKLTKMIAKNPNFKTLKQAFDLEI